ncbi:MAG: hypothetical protein WC455_06495 [Dehalococcoidia bacterium]
MSKKTERYVVADRISDDYQKFRVGFSQFDKLCRNAENPVKAVLLLPTKHNIDDDTTLASFLRRNNTREIVEDLRVGRDVILPCGTPFSLETTQSFNDSGEPLIVLAVNTSAGMLTKIDEAKNLQSVIVVPGRASDVADWKRQWEPYSISEY